MNWTIVASQKLLKGKNAVVTGASRGVGKGIALVLGEAGATVFIPGRSKKNSTTSDNMPGNIDDTAEEITKRGGLGIPIYCDHSDEGSVRDAFKKISGEVRLNGIDILVNNVWGGYEGYDGEKRTDGTKFGQKFWEQNVNGRWEGMFERGVRAHMYSSIYAAPLMLEAAKKGTKGLIINTTAWAFDKYIGDFYYDIAKAAVNRLAVAQSEDLKEFGISAITLAPGWTRTERVLAANLPDLTPTESPEYIGRAVACLAANPEVAAGWAGRTMPAAEVAERFDFTDIDGRRMPAFKM
eukprot:TRINITY_DN8397_c0_g1_i1.p1 TRINITY_DN8397_c0_g1~~TRINITY_DN8397_c0_g1_i1.p1  ORF type:complete len:295 (-),score=60.53 TRINITY_DN8397_c0_g1_i1:256-1140(-)